MTPDPTVMAHHKLLVAVLDRAERELTLHNYKRTTLLMDLEGIPGLDLEALTTVAFLDFSHDIHGIRRHMDRSTYPGKLMDCFEPRCMLAEVAA